MTEPLDRLEQALTKLGSEHRPPEGWEARVLAATKQPPRRRWWLALPIVAVVGAVALWLTLDGEGEAVRPAALDLALTYDRSATVVRRVASPHPDDIAHVKAVGGGGYRAIWVYRDDHLILACPGFSGEGSCQAGRDASIIDVPLGVGSFAFVVLSWDAPLSPPTGTYDDDQSWAERTGVTHRERTLTIR